MIPPGSTAAAAGLLSITAVPAGVDLGCSWWTTAAWGVRSRVFGGLWPEAGPAGVAGCRAFQFSELNNRAAEQARGSVLLLLNNDVELLSPNWGAELAANALRPGVGCVGAQLHYPDGTIQHGGVVLGIGGMAGLCA